MIFGSAIVGMLGAGEESGSEQPSSVSSSEPDSSQTTSGSDLPGLGEGLIFESGVEIYAESIDESPSIPNQFVIDPDSIKGELVSVRFYLKNGSNEEINVSSSSVKGLIDSAEYEPVGIFSDAGDWYVFEPVGPGLETTFDVFFDIPVGRNLTGAIYETSLFLGDQAEFTFR